MALISVYSGETPAVCHVMQLEVATSGADFFFLLS